MKTENGRRTNSDRYEYDFGPLTTKAGWAQVDTTQDAWYYGTWANPFTLQTFEYCEGDTTLQTAENEQEFVDAMRELKRWNDEGGRWLGVDPGFNADLKAQFHTLGLGDLLDYPASA